jgi:glyoxylase-like metal-dependent hydrolase (beta-lactamase superfamily II)
MKLYTINTGFFKLDGGAMFGVVPKTIWNKLNPADADNLCSWAMRCLLVEEGDKLLLIDTGIGNKQDAKFFSHYHLHGNDTLDASLAVHGFHRNDITDVLLTHLHFDHCGGSILRSGDRFIPAFPNAVYWSNQRHWNWATHPNDREKASFLRENILPIEESGRLCFLECRTEAFLAQKDAAFEPQPFPGISGFSVILAGGHTDAMMLPVIEYKGRHIVYLADLMPSAAHIPLPYVMGYDMFPLTTLMEKKQLLREAAKNDWVLYFEHDPLIECCTVSDTEKGVRKKESFLLSEL